jgi:hypothetical protein
MLIHKAVSGSYTGMGPTRAAAMQALLTQLDVDCIPVVTMPLPTFSTCEIVPHRVDNMIEVIRV